MIGLNDVMDRQVSISATPWVAKSLSWVYSAVDFDVRPGTVRGHIWFEVEGIAQLDDLVLCPTNANLVFNSGFDTDTRGRIGMWSEETAAIRPGARGGRFASTPNGHTGAGLELTAEPNKWYASRVVPANVVPGVTTYRLSCWTKSEGGKAQVGVVWLDRDEKVLRTELTPPGAGSEGWQCQSLTTAMPAGAVQVAAVALVSSGKAVCDDFSLFSADSAQSRKPVIRVFVNQASYGRVGPKSAVVATNFFPTDNPKTTLEILDNSGKAVASSSMQASRIHDGESADWGSYFWRGDFSSLQKSGRYRAVCRIGSSSGSSVSFTIGDNALIEATGKLCVDFFFVQRCGYDVPGWHHACHLDDARLPGGEHIDATGGWHSAGDYNKIIYENGDGGVAYALMKAFDTWPDYFRRFDRDHTGAPDIVSEALWGARFVAKVQNPDTGGLYKDIRQGPGRDWMKWCPPEEHTDGTPGTADDPVIDTGEGYSPLVTVAWAKLAKLPDSVLGPNDFRDRVDRYWEYLKDNNPAGNSPHLLICALDLFATTNEASYDEFAHKSAGSLLQGQNKEGRYRGAWGTGGELNAGALALYALAHPKESLSDKIRTALADYAEFLYSTADNPFGLSKQSVGEKDYFFEPTSALGLNFNQLQKGWAAALIYRVNKDPRALVFATDQIDWVLGKNPYNLCMMEGAGAVNPPRYHHRYDSIPGHERGAVPGCIPNGFVRDVSGEDRPGFDMSRPGPGKRHASYRTSEPWLVHNMWYLLALTALPR